MLIEQAREDTLRGERGLPWASFRGNFPTLALSSLWGVRDGSLKAVGESLLKRHPVVLLRNACSPARWRGYFQTPSQERCGGSLREISTKAKQGVKRPPPLIELKYKN